MRALLLGLLLLAPITSALTVAEHEEGPGTCDWRMTWADTGAGPWVEGSAYCQDGRPASQIAFWSDDAYVVWWGQSNDAALAVYAFGFFDSERVPLGPPDAGWGRILP